MSTETEQTQASSITSPPAIITRQLRFCWPGQANAPSFPDIELNQGEHLFLHGPSGTGKSTLLGLLAGMLAPDSGSVELLGQALTNLKPGARDRFRANHMGVIFQQFNLVPYLSALANVTLPCRLSPIRRARTDSGPDAAAANLLRQLAIPESHWHQGVTRLSIGQQQRVAAARALIGAPEIILADEPTSALDADNRDRFLDLLLTLAEQRRCSVVFVSHDRALSSHFHHQLALGGEA
ncbi:ATP-binding cassette domain-containing protein [Marinobacter halophilus]|uniref:Methionine ABC transporter ATP-binding protein n=1 Tax=Marinobacter halophilus TaxID=1323740 RepID=A0A2T1KEX5_9GAMM|nr:ATP-binding cassette domain-containing protein [Marinobacter halophilus]PSF08676.1 methionine ABC transporter ATP-binding protein [Marinobacter halophilus]GGC62793.1 ABC transporter ATP-binding protein [Marinobacter halophilus]